MHVHHHPLPPAGLVALVVADVLDEQLAALAWLLLERGAPVLVAGPVEVAATRSAAAAALAEALPPERRPAGTPGGDRLVRIADTLGGWSPAGVLRAALGATTRRSGLLATVEATDLEGVLDIVAGQGVGADEASFLGAVLVIGLADDPPRPRVIVAHYLRPVARDAGGHTRRLGPAVLAARDVATGRWEDFAWGIGPDLAERCRMRPGDYERERERRARLLAAAAGRDPDPGRGQGPG